MGMERPFPFSSNLTSLNSFLMRVSDIDFLLLWERMVLEFNSRTEVLIKRIEIARNIQLKDGVLWMSLGMLVAFGALIGVGRGLAWLCCGKEGVKSEVVVKEEEIETNGHLDGGGVVLSEDEKEIHDNGNGTAKNAADKKDDSEILALREELQAAKAEIERLMPFRDETDRLKSKLDLLSQGAEDQEKQLACVANLERDLADAKSECQTLTNTTRTQEIEISKFQLFATEADELRSHLESAREEIASRDKEIEALKEEKSKVEQDLETAYKEFETVTQRAAASCEIEEKLREENSELAKKVEELKEEHERESKALQDTHENDLAKQQLAHEQEKQSLRDEYEGKVKEARTGLRQRPVSIASSDPTVTESEGGSLGRRTPTRFLASLKRRSRSSLSGSFSENSVKGSGSKDQKTGK